MNEPQVAVVGLAVMGSNLARNIMGKGFPVAVYNRTASVTDDFMGEYGQMGFVSAKSLEELVVRMRAPRQVILMIKAGSAVDAVIEQLLPLLDKGDVIVDGGNSFYLDSNRREQYCREHDVHFVGLGVSGGEEGALHGPSLMPGGDRRGWELLAPMLEKIAADADGPCTTYIGPAGSGHFVKMVHNGIEYGDMQLIAEAYHLLRSVGLTPLELADVFEQWNSGELSSFLIEITAEIFRKRDELSDGFLVDAVLDRAGQKGTGRWTVQAAIELGVSAPTLASAVTARVLSSMKEERVEAAKIFPAPSDSQMSQDREALVTLVFGALYSAKIMAYAQGMAIMQAASDEWDWKLELGRIAAIWKGGCIIRAKFLDEIRAAYERTGQLANLMCDDFMRSALVKHTPALRQVVAYAANVGVPIPAFAASLAYYDSYRTELLPQSLTQAQRDYFGAHTYQRLDREGTFHSEWAAESSEE
jgi:6-phosphogluconate dehydrogenase